MKSTFESIYVNTEYLKFKVLQQNILQFINLLRPPFPEKSNIGRHNENTISFLKKNDKNIFFNLYVEYRNLMVYLFELVLKEVYLLSGTKEKRKNKEKVLISIRDNASF